MPPKPRCRLDNTQKKTICQFKAANPAMSQLNVMDHFNRKWGSNISKSGISKILSESSKWLATDERTAHHKTNRDCANRLLEEVLYLWFITNGPAGKGADIPGDVLREMAEVLAKDPRFEVDPSFKFSNGWFDGFKRRFNIKDYKRHGESASSDVAAIDGGREEIARLVAQYPRHLVYNMDETAKRYNLRPTHTYATANVAGYKQSKERLTVALCANADGSHKHGLYVIGTAKKPRSFPKDWTPRLLDITWASNKTAWMNGITYTEFVTDFDDKMMQRYGGEEVLLLMDNAPSHKLEEGIVLKCTRVKFLPPNTTTHLQPMDAGIIANFKHHYKKLSTRAQLKMIIRGQPVKITPYQALCLCKKAWDAVTAQTIERCWYHTGIIPRPNDRTQESDNVATAEEDTRLTESIQDSLDEMQRELPDQHILSAQQYAAADDNLPTEAELTVEEAVEIVLSHDPEDTCILDPDTAEQPEPLPTQVPLKQILEQMHDLQDSVMSRSDLGYVMETLSSLIVQVDTQLQHKKTTQTSIENFFKM